jgi:hypothetical protein
MRSVRPIAALPRRPTVYEINVAVWLNELGTDLAHVPPKAWDRLAALPVDVVWLMGVWTRSPAGRAIALADPNVHAGNDSALPDLDPDDVIGSPYCIQDYVVDKRIGGPEALAIARDQLAARGIRLVLDFVPNHVAPDHVWVEPHPDFFVRADAQDLAASPDEFVQAADGIFARGRDPNLPPWPDVIQLDAFSTELRDAVVATLRTIADQCDGVRCDMAMLVTNDVFVRTWGERAGSPPESDYWPTIINAVRATHPHFGFIAESYWDTEAALQAQGFDLCYDKRLYDELVGGTADGLRALLEASPAYQERLVRFIENHDEVRAASVFPSGRARAAAVVMSTVEGARLYHEGQLEGARLQVPVFLGRRPKEPADPELRAFYGTLIRAVGDAELRDGIWQLCDGAAPGQPTLLAWTWTMKDRRRIIVVNFADEPAHGRVRLPWDDLAGRTWRLEDVLAGNCFECDGGALADEGLQVELTAWGTRLLALQPRS